MENRQLFANDISLDFLADDEVLPLILQVNDLGDVQSLQGNGSKAFKLPLNQKNRQALGFPDDITITTNTPYEQIPAKYFNDGIELVSSGYLEIIDVQNNVADVILIFGNNDFLDRIGGQIYDMGDSTTFWSGYGTNLVWNQYSLPYPGASATDADYIDYPPTSKFIQNCVFDVAHAAYSQQKTDGWIWPIVNYGNINTTPPFNGHINVRNIRPAFFLHTAISLLVQSTGYTINQTKSCIYNDPQFANLYQKLLIQFSNSDFEHGTDFQNTPDNLGVVYTLGQDQVISRPRSDLDIIWDQTNIYTNDNPYSNVIRFGSSDHFTATQNVDFTATVQFDCFVRGRYTGQVLNAVFKFTIVDVDGGIVDAASLSIQLDPNYTRLGGSGGGVYGQETFLNQKLSSDFSLVTGQKLYVRVHIDNIGQNGTTDTYVIVRKNASFSIVTNEKLVLWKQPIQCERILPDIAQLDLLKTTLQKFGLILISDPNNGEIVFTSLKTIVNNIPIAKDWSDKCKDMGRQINFKLGNYCQVNYLRYQFDDTIPLNYMPKYFADDNIPIADRTLNPTQPTQTLFQSIWSPSINVPYIGGSIAQISSPTNTDEFSVGGQPRLLIDQKLNILNTGRNVIFSDNDPGFETETIAINDVISVPYFYKPDAPDLSPAASHLCWNDKPGNGVHFTGAPIVSPGLKSTYLSELTGVLTQTKKVTRYFYLTPLDILEMDFTVPVYLRQDGCYYYISKVDSWVKGQVCKVDLVKIA